MDTFTTSLTHRAQKGLLNVDKETQNRIQKAIDTLKTDPVPTLDYDVRKLEGREDDYRIRIGWYRIQYTINWNAKHIDVFDIDRRKDRSYK